MVSISYPETKDQWARDDPAFLVLLSIWLCGKLPFVATIPVTSNCSLFVQVWHPHPRPLLATLLEGCHEDFNLPGTLNTQSWGIERPGSSWLLFSCCLWVCFLFLLSSSLLLSNFTWYQTACLLFPMKQCNFLFSFVSSWLYYCSFFPSRYKKMGHSWLSGECCSPFLLNVLCYYSVFNLVIFHESDPSFLYCCNQWLFVFLDSVVNWLCYCTSYSVYRIFEVLIMGCFCGLHWCWSHHSFVAMVS